VYSTVSALQLNNPFSTTAPNLVPNSSSPIVYGTAHYNSWGTGVNDTYNPDLPISYDTTSPATYNVPAFAPDFDNNKAINSFFTRTNFVGAFGRTTAGNDNWMAGWCNFDPLNEPYDTVCYTAPVTSVAEAGTAAANAVKVFPNPAAAQATVTVDVARTGTVIVVLMDVSGREIKVIYTGAAAPGTQSYEFSTADIANGMYLISVISDNKHKLIRFSIAK
jgi:hypothetical protein